MPDWSELVQEWRVELGLCLLGLVLVIYGVYSWQSGKTREEFSLRGSEQIKEEADNKIIVDVGGQVNKPGVYELVLGSRVGEALEMAGGLTQIADHEGVALSVNKAERLKDGQKIYIPARNESGIGSSQRSNMISINRASTAELESLPGVGAATAEKIVKARPFTSMDQLKTKGVLGDKQYEKLSGLISL